jgi:hypothetical protein
MVASYAQAAETVRIEDATQPSTCAENDNVYARFIASGIRHFTIEARHPSYIATVTKDSTAPDFGTCDQSHDPGYSFTPLDVILFEDSNYRLVGHRFARFWRPDQVPFAVGDRVTVGLHLVQLLRKQPGGDIEILVLYPADGYWRLKPLPPPGHADTAYGSSFLAGPVRQDGRPYVALSSIAFDPATLTFRLGFASGLGALRVVEATPADTRVEVTLPPSAAPIEFAALRSMFVSDAMADTAEAALETGDSAVRRYPVLAFPPTDITAATFLRATPSRHNTSAPDMVFSDFARD